MKTRLLQAEDMDDPTLPPAELIEALTGLARLNRISFSASALWHVLEHAYLGCCATHQNRPPWTVMDLATGGGDLPIRLAEWARRKAYPWQILGADINPIALDRAAHQAAAQGVNVEWLRLDVTRDPLPDCDWAISSLFLHHLDESTVVSVLSRMAQAARVGVLIDDLERTNLNRGLVCLGAHLLSRSAVVHQDSDRSLLAAFTLPEITALAHQAGLHPVQIASRFPARFQLLWTR
ncbi:MAG: methyltransferase domain-containing protein [Methylococcaceae bacterium]